MDRKNQNSGQSPEVNDRCDGLFPGPAPASDKTMIPQWAIALIERGEDPLVRPMDAHQPDARPPKVSDIGSWVKDSRADGSSEWRWTGRLFDEDPVAQEISAQVDARQATKLLN